MDTELTPEVSTQEKNLIAAAQQQFTECCRYDELFDVFRATLFPLLGLDGAFLVRYDQQFGHTNIISNPFSDPEMDPLVPSLKACIDQVVFGNPVSDPGHLGMVVFSANDLNTNRITARSGLEFRGLSDRFATVIGIHNGLTPRVGIWVYRNSCNGDDFSASEIKLLKYLRPLLVLAVQSVIFHEERTSYCDIAELFIASNDPKAVVDKDITVLLHNRKFAEQIYQFDNYALPTRLHRQILNFINEPHRVSDIIINAGLTYFRLRRRLYEISVSSIAKDIDLENRTWLLTMKRISDSEMQLSRKLKTINITRRETEVILWLKKGFSNAQVAQKLSISEHTVKSHIKNIYKKLAVSSFRELMTFVHHPE